MLRFNQIVYGPVHSRRLGASLGVNLLPLDGKLCNFDCIYCECGWNRDGRTSTLMPLKGDVIQCLEQRLSEIGESGEPLDVITFAGHGEPTLNPEFPEIIDATLELRQKYCPSAKVAVLSNSLTLGRPEIVAALRKVDEPIMKLDAPTTALMRSINRPSVNCTVENVVRSLEVFNGDFIMQTMFLGGAHPDYRTDKEALQEWFGLVRHLHPRQVMVYTLDRPAPSAGLEKFSMEEMEQMLSPLIAEGFNIRIN